MEVAMSASLSAIARVSGAHVASPSGCGDGQDRWFVGYTKPREEERAQENLVRQGFECHLPLMRVQKRKKGRVTWRREPLFPRYLFLRPGPGAAPMDRVRSTFGMTGLVQFDGIPATIAQAIVEDLKALGEDFRRVLFKPGECVKLVDGPLAGLAGVFERAEGEARAIVLLDFLSRRHRLAVPLESVQAAG
jgi:transcriptional antiterminator RfaH